MSNTIKCAPGSPKNHHVDIMWILCGIFLIEQLKCDSHDLESWSRGAVFAGTTHLQFHNLEELKSSSTSGQTQIKTLHWKSHNISAAFAIGNSWLWWSIFDWIFKMSSSSNASNAPFSPLALPPWSQDNDRPARNPALDVLSGPRVAESRSRRMQFCSS